MTDLVVLFYQHLWLIHLNVWFNN